MYRINCKVLFAPRTSHGGIVEGATTMLIIYEKISAHAKKLGQLMINMLPYGISQTPYQRSQSNPNQETRSSTSRRHPRFLLPPRPLIDWIVTPFLPGVFGEWKGAVGIGDRRTVTWQTLRCRATDASSTGQGVAIQEVLMFFPLVHPGTACH